jgi:hypothetical protein
LSTLCLFAAVIGVRAEQWGDFTYTSSGSAITITHYTGAGGAVDVPNMIAGLPVTRIEDYTFDWEYSANMTSVTLPANVTSIGSSAFSDCTFLTAITVDGANAAFSSLAGVLFNKSRTLLVKFPTANAGSYAVPEGVADIGDYAFAGCASLTSVTLPASVTSIGQEAFRTCYGLTGFTLPEGVKSIGKKAFDRCGKLAGITIPGSVTNIGDFAFISCASLSSVTLPDGITRIGPGVFYSCTSLAGITLPAGVASLGNYAFAYCTKLEGAYFKGNAPTLGSSVFEGDTKATIYRLSGATGWPVVPNVWGTRPTALWSLSGPFALTVNNGSGGGSYTNGQQVAIAANAPAVGKTFDRWTGDTACVADILSAATTVTMPGQAVSLTATYKDAVYTLTVNGGSGSGAYVYEEYVPITADAPPPGKVFDQWVGYVYVLNKWSPSTTVIMRDQTVSVTATYKDITYTLTVNGGGGGGSYTNGQRVAIAANAPEPGTVFDRWTGDTQHAADALSPSTTVTMPAQTVTLTATYRNVYALTVVHGSGGGSYSSGQQVQIAANAPAYGQVFDRWTGDVQSVADVLSPITTVTMPAQAVTVTAAYREGYTLTVVRGSGSGSYTNGQQVALAAEAPEAGYAFYRWFGNTQTVANASAPATILTMPAAHITLTATYTALSAGDYTWGFCGPDWDNLGIRITGYTGPGGAVTIPHTITGMPVQWIDQEAFMGVTRMTSVTIPDSVNFIGYHAFSGCTGLTSLAIPGSVRSIGEGAFGDCTGLVDITLAEGLKDVGFAAFACTSLEQVTFPHSVTNIGGDGAISGMVFHSCTSLTDVTLGRGVMEFAKRNFHRCPNMRTITVSPDNPYYYSLDGVLFKNNPLTLHTFPPGRTENYTVPDGVTRIGDFAFYNFNFDYASVTNIIIPASVTSIGDGGLLAGGWCSFYFEGNAPSLNDNSTIGFGFVYYRAGTAGWGPTYGGCETRLWVTGGGGDPDALTVTAVTPADQAQNVSRSNPGIRATFSANLDPGTVDSETFAVFYSDGLAAIPGSLEVTGNTVRFTPDAPLDEAKPAVAVTVRSGPTGVRSADGYLLSEDYTWGFYTLPVFNVAGVTPTNLAQQVFWDDPGVSATFTAAVDSNTVSSATFAVTYAADGAVVAGRFNVQSNTVAFIPSSPLRLNGHVVRVTVKGGSAGVKAAPEAGGVPLPGDTVWTFTTMPKVTVQATHCQVVDDMDWVQYKDASVRVALLWGAAGTTSIVSSVTGKVTVVWHDGSQSVQDNVRWADWDVRGDKYDNKRLKALGLTSAELSRGNVAVFSTVRGNMPRSMVDQLGGQEYRATVELCDGNGRIKAFACTNALDVKAQIQGQKTPRVHYFPLWEGAYETNASLPFMDGFATRQNEFMQKVYPLPFVLYSSASSPPDIYWLCNHLNPLNLLSDGQYLAAIYTDMEDYREAIGVDVVVGVTPTGWLKKYAGAVGEAGANWLTMNPLPVALVEEGVEDHLAAHEIGHFYAYDSRDNPHSRYDPDMSGFDPFSETRYAVGLPVLPHNTGDFMDEFSANNPRGTTWANRQTYGLLMNRFVQGGATPFAASVPRAVAAALGGPVTLDVGAGCLVVRGIIALTNAVYSAALTRIYQVDDHEVSADSPSGDFTVAAFDGAGTLLSSVRIDPVFVANEQGESVAFFKVYFGDPSAITRVSVRRLGVEVGSLTRPAVAPGVAVTAPAAGATVTGPLTVSWSGGGETPARYHVFYRPDAGQPWSVLGYDVTNQTLTAAAGSVACGSNAQVRVVANDGFNSVEALSGVFEVRQTPSVVSCSPADGEAFAPVGAAVTLYFSTPMAPETVTADTVRLCGAGGTNVAGFVRYEPAANRALFMPDKPLSPLSVYTVRVDTAAASLLGETLPEAFVSGFRTASDSYPPSVSLTNPVAPCVLTLGQPLTLHASATGDADRVISSVVFYADGQNVGEAVAEPFSCSWTPSVPGMSSVLVYAYDDEERRGMSGSATFRIAPEGYTYTTNNGTLTLTGFHGAATVSIPEELDGNPITGIGANAFYGDFFLSRVTIPASVTNIGDTAFAGCSGLAALYFRGNAPALGSAVFADSGNTTVYHATGTTGWPASPATYGGLPTVLWNPQVQGGGSFGVRENQFGFSITNAGSPEVVIEACTDLSNPLWTPVATNTLTGGSAAFVDPTWTNHPARFYRLSMP